MTPTSRTLDALRGDGWIVEVVERWIPGANIRRDFLGVGDVLAMRADALLLVQCTSDANISARISKAKIEPRLRTWLADPSRGFEVWGWSRRGGRWECRKVPVVLDEVGGVVPIIPDRRKPRKRERTLFDRLESQKHPHARNAGASCGDGMSNDPSEYPTRQNASHADCGHFNHRSNRKDRASA